MSESVKQSIQNKLSEAFSPIFLTVENESHMHNVPAHSETHFKVTIVSESFAGKRLLQRHRAVNEVVAEELAGPVHALALHTYTREDWDKKQQTAPQSPSCMGGSAK